MLETLGNIVIIVALILGSLMILSVCYVYIKTHTLAFSGMGMCVIAVTLVGLSIWKTIRVSIDGEGIKADLGTFVQVIQETNTQLQQVKSEAQEAKKKVDLVEDYVYTVKTQKSLQEVGIYKGAVDGTWSPGTQDSLKKFQMQKHIPATGILDTDTINALQIKPISEIPLKDPEIKNETPVIGHDFELPAYPAKTPEWEELVKKYPPKKELGETFLFKKPLESNN